jgi:hypothetical protein
MALPGLVAAQNLADVADRERAWDNLGNGIDTETAEAFNYITRVEQVDGQPLEQAVKSAIIDFILGCKSDGLWPAIKASCILAGARTLDGALVPLVGAAPTNNNFVSGNYDRKTGLAGGTGRHLNTNRPENADPQNSFHMSFFRGSGVQTNSFAIGARSTASVFTIMGSSTYVRNGLIAGLPSYNNGDAGFYGAVRQSANLVIHRGPTEGNVAVNNSSQPPGNLSHFVGAYNNQGTAANSPSFRLSFYSIGESLDLALLDVRVTALMTALAAAIP